MKKLFLFPLTTCLLFVSSCGNNQTSTGNNTNTGTNNNSNIIETIDYSSCPYIGLGSHYVVTNGTSYNYVSLHVFFDPDGVGAWGSYKYNNGTETSEVHEFTYRLYGEVNISYILKEDTTQGGRGYFTTDSTGQVFVYDGLHFPRYS